VNGASSGVTKAAELAGRLRPVIADARVLAAIASVPRELFVPRRERKRAYDNVALPIDCGQTISQPLVVARMLEVLALREDDRALDVGTGSGYHAALLALLCEHVWTIERHAQLSTEAAEAIGQLGIANVTFVVGDGWAGLPERAPFDAINVAAATGATIPAALEEQLAPGGRMVAPVGTTDQHLILAQRNPEGIVRAKLEAVRFVPLVREDPDR
jgi:protein-L-isoaspartate(D-aspartate) O-methyltransferase